MDTLPLRRSSLTIRPCSWIRQGRDEIGWQARPTYRIVIHTYHSYNSFIHSTSCLEEPPPFVPFVPFVLCPFLSSLRDQYFSLGSSSDSWSECHAWMNGAIMTWCMYVCFVFVVEWNEQFSYVRIFFFFFELRCACLLFVVRCSMFDGSVLMRIMRFSS